MNTLTSASPKAGPSTLRSPPRSPLPPSPVLLHPLPPTSSIHAESILMSSSELDRQAHQHQLDRDLADALQTQHFTIDRSAVRDAMGTTSSGRLRGAQSRAERPTAGFKTRPQAYELYAAIDRKDIDYIMRVRDHAFGLLLEKNAGEFPVVYAARRGEGWRDVTILLIGAMSRWALGRAWVQS